MDIAYPYAITDPDTLAVAKPQSYSHSTGAAAPAQPDTNTNGLG